jgi:hypothetical protein
VITNRGGKKLELEVERLCDEVVTLKTAIEEAIRKGQKSIGGLGNIPRSGLVSNEDFVINHMNASSGIVG